jgi:site-specific recombinase XerD
MTLESGSVLRLQIIEKGRQQYQSEKEPSSETSTLSQVFEEYLEWKRLHDGVPMESQERTKSSFKANFKKIKGKQVHQINEGDIKHLRYEMLANGRVIKTVYTYLSLVRTVFNFNNKKTASLFNQSTGLNSFQSRVNSLKLQKD